MGASEPDEAERALAEVEARVAELERREAELAPVFAEGRRLLSALKKRRQLGSRAGLRGVSAEARDAARVLSTAVGCAALIAGTHALEASWSPVVLVLAFVVLVVEGSR
jgi:hypothetical protein